MVLTLNSVSITDPNTFLPLRQRIERADRTADGTLVVDVISIKMNYELTYDHLTGTEILPFITLYNSGAFTTFTYPEGGSTQSKTVRISNITHSLHYYVGTTEYWKDVRISLVEQ